MRRSLYRKLAFANIKRNAQTYTPFILSCMFTVLMFYSVFAMADNPTLKRMSGGVPLNAMLAFGTGVVGLFALIFLFYTNSFLVKRRKKEFGLFNILGMEKRHIAKIMFWETIYVSLGSIALGLAAGILVSKLIFLVLLQILKFPVPLGFHVSSNAIVASLVLFGGIFFLTLLHNLRQVHLAKPIELLKGDQVGEREPRTKWLLVLLGIATLGTGYALALSIEAPLGAQQFFFIAVFLVIIGTYCLFTAGSIGLLKLLRQNKRFYYRAPNFIAVSGMIYRMKQNAAGLANICILSTMVLVTLSTTISLYVGVEDVLNHRYPQEIIIRSREQSDTEVAKVLAQHDAAVSNKVQFRYFSLPVLADGDVYTAAQPELSLYTANLHMLVFLPQADFACLQGEQLVLGEDEVLIYSSGRPHNSASITVLGKTFEVKQELKDFIPIGDAMGSIVNTTYVVVQDLALVEEVGASLADVSHYLGFDLDATSEQILAVYQALRSSFPGSRVESREEAREDFYVLYGGLFFLGIFLGTLFIMATVLIIYYKQITEGFEDKQRFIIMQQVGMGREEVRGAVRKQVLMVFFLPLITAGVHVAFAFKLITKLLALFNLSNITLYVLCTLATFAAFAVLYALVYRATAKVYYQLVEHA